MLPCSPSAPGLPTSPPLGCTWTHAPLPSTHALLLPPFLGLRRLTLPSLGERRGVSAKWMGTCAHTREPSAGTPRWGVVQPTEEADVWGALAPSLRKGEGRWGGACRHPSCYVFVIGHRTYSFHLLIFLYRDLPPLIIRRYHRTAFFPFSLSVITSIVDCPLRYLVALCLSAYQWLFLYLSVRYIDSQSGGTVGFGLCPLRLVTLLARVPQQYIRMY